MCKVALAAAITAALAASGIKADAKTMEHELEKAADTPMPFIMLVRSISSNQFTSGMLERVDTALKIEEILTPLRAQLEDYVRQREHEKNLKNQIRTRLRIYKLYRNGRRLPVASTKEEDELWDDDDYPNANRHRVRRTHGVPTDFDDLQALRIGEQHGNLC